MPTTSVTSLNVTDRYFYTESGTSLVFDKVVADVTVPEGTPPDAWDSSRNLTTVTGTLSP